MISKLSKNHFWTWFKRNNKEFLYFPNKSHAEKNYWLKELNAHLRAYGKFIKFRLEVSENRKNGILTISVDGKTCHFDKIDHFILIAPEITGWQFHSLLQPRPPNLIEDDFGYGPIDLDDLWFDPLLDIKTGELIDFTIYYTMFTTARSKEIHATVRNILWNILGERIFGEKVWDIYIENRSTAPCQSKLIKLELLPAYFGPSRSSIEVNNLGELQ